MNTLLERVVDISLPAISLPNRLASDQSTALLERGIFMYPCYRSHKHASRTSYRHTPCFLSGSAVLEREIFMYYVSLLLSGRLLVSELTGFRRKLYGNIDSNSRISSLEPSSEQQLELSWESLSPWLSISTWASQNCRSWSHFLRHIYIPHWNFQLHCL